MPPGGWPHRAREPEETEITVLQGGAEKRSLRFFVSLRDTVRSVTSVLFWRADS
jgi:hypothetical protein